MSTSEGFVKTPVLVPDNGLLTAWSPSSSLPITCPRRLKRGLLGLSSLGYRVAVAESCGAVRSLGACDPAKAADDLMTTLEGDADAVIAAVGGNGALRVLPHLDLERIAECGKPIVGYSDITAILHAVSHTGGLASFHGPMVMSEFGEFGGPVAFTARSFRSALSGPLDGRYAVTSPVTTDELLPWDSDDVRPRRLDAARAPVVLRSGKAAGRLWGGNLAVLSMLCGTPWFRPVDGAVVFLEAEGLGPDATLGLLEQLHLAGAFRQASAVLVGRPSRPPGGLPSFDEALALFFARFSIPVVTHLDIGHTEPMATLPVGREVELEVDETSVLIEAAND